MTARPRVLVVGLNYAPESTGIAPYTAGMARGLAEQYDVNVVTAHPHYPQWEVLPGYGGGERSELVDGIPVKRLLHYVPHDPAGVSRIVSEASFALRVALARQARPDAVVVVTPALLPMGPVLARARRWGAPVGVVVQDLYGKAAGELGLLGGGLERAITALEGRLLRASDSVVSIHERMARAIADDYGVSAERLSVIPNWTHIEEFAGDRTVVRQRLGWIDDVVVLHAGNMGAKQGLEHVVTAARRAQELGRELRFVLMGDGARRSDLGELAIGVKTLEFMEPVSGGDFAGVLAAADVLLLHERPGLKEMCAPSKLTSYFAAARPVLGATDADSAAAHEVRSSGAGVVVPSGDPDALLAGLDELLAADGAEVGRRGAEYARTRLSEQAALSDYRDWVGELLCRR
ncbi:glycosyltransferase [Nocardioides sp. SOB77]|uniref:Glycosyltransferase n=1 Tax=Nocardioides oceani TaxID=3058369 RepID=A0ABT8FJ00_9ACTN|nr:glycosyltransferase [Nocardioides oceani]MDN4174520.1 glycosyltransferase [Nocardioides oceani]